MNTYGFNNLGARFNLDQCNLHLIGLKQMYDFLADDMWKFELWDQLSVSVFGKQLPTRWRILVMVLRIQFL